MAHYCYSGNPDCSPLSPCEACYGFIQGVVLPRAMFIAGEPFSADANLAMLFIRSFQQAYREGIAAVNEQFRAEAQARAAEQQAAPKTPSIEEFKGAILDQIQQMPDEKYVETALKLHSGHFDGWDSLEPEEQFVLLELFQPPPTANSTAEEAPAPPAEVADEQAAAEQEGDGDPMSAANAAAVVAAIRNGTLSPETKATPPQQPIEPAPDAPAADSPQAPGQHPRVQSSEGQPAGTENSANVESKQESTTS